MDSDLHLRAPMLHRILEEVLEDTVKLSRVSRDAPFSFEMCGHPEFTGDASSHTIEPDVFTAPGLPGSAGNGEELGQQALHRLNIVLHAIKMTLQVRFFAKQLHLKS